jgi:hypothetical protein
MCYRFAVDIQSGEDNIGFLTNAAAMSDLDRMPDYVGADRVENHSAGVGQQRFRGQE